MWDLFRLIFKKPKEKFSGVASYDAPFAAPRVHRIVIPPKPSNLVAPSIAPQHASKRYSSSLSSSPLPQVGSGEVSLILFGTPIESVKTVDTLSTGVRYPTHALFERS